MRSSRPRNLAGSIAAVLALGALLVWPAIATVREAIFYGDTGPIGGWDRPLTLAFETIRLIVATLAIALPLGAFLGFVIGRTDLPGRGALRTLMILSALVPMPLHAIGWLGALGNAGRSQLFGGQPLIQGWLGAAFVHAMAALPWVVLITEVGFRSVDPDLEDAALLDLPAWRVVARVSLRGGLGGILAAALIVAVLTGGDMTVTDLLRIRTYAEEAYLQEALGKGPAAMAVVTIPPWIVLGSALLAMGSYLLAFPAATAPARPVRVWRLGRVRWPLAIGIGLTIGEALALPIEGLIWRAGRLGGSAALGIPPHWSIANLGRSLSKATWAILPYLKESFILAAVGAVASVALAWLLSWLARKSVAWRLIVSASVALALATPGPVAGMALVLGFRHMPGVYDGPVIIMMAHVLRTFAFAVAISWVAIRSIPGVYFDQAETEGLGDVAVAARVALPLTRGAIFVAWLVAFLLALGELPATKMVESPGMKLLSVFVWGLLHTGVESHLAAVGLVLLLIFLAGGLAARTAWARGWSRS